MSGTDSFRRLVNRLPVSWEKLLGMGLRYFLERQDPESVNFTIHNNGWSIDVETSEERTQSALDFWETHVEEKL